MSCLGSIPGRRTDYSCYFIMIKKTWEGVTDFLSGGWAGIPTQADENMKNFVLIRRQMRNAVIFRLVDCDKL